MEKYPIAEIFTSIQGEGLYAGQMQTFIRLAGCTVGKPYSPVQRAKHNIPIYTERCTLYDGRNFPCDTDYRKHESLTADEIIKRIPENVLDVCITGGEPLMHDLSALLTALSGIQRKVHIETSGTKSFFGPADVWITVSPKMGVIKSMIQRADELKLLVDKDFNPEFLLLNDKDYSPIYLAKRKLVWLQPVNSEYTISAENLQLCRDWQIRYPDFRISMQGHKVMTHFLKEEVR